MTKLVKKYTLLGYGRWWRLIEMLRGEDDYKLKFNDTEGYSVFCKQLCFKKDEAAKLFISELIFFELLTTDGEYIWSEDLRERMAKMDKRKELGSLYGKKGAAIMRQKQANSNEEIEQTDRGTSIAPHTNTQHNNTLHNNIMMLEEQPTAKKDDDMYRTNRNTQTLLEFIAEGVMKDQMFFVHPHCMARGISPQQLQAWLMAFNKHLNYIGDVRKSEKDYRIHFAHWFKFQDAGADAASYKPLPEAVAPPQPLNTTTTKSYDEILQARQREVDGM
jgi:hypothetical protein